MSNIRVLQRVEKLSKELRSVAHYVELYGGVSKQQARDVILNLRVIQESIDTIFDRAVRYDAEPEVAEYLYRR